MPVDAQPCDVEKRNGVFIEICREYAMIEGARGRSATVVPALPRLPGFSLHHLVCEPTFNAT